MKKYYPLKELKTLSHKELKEYRKFILNRSYPTNSQSDQLLKIECIFIDRGFNYNGTLNIRSIKA